MPSPPNPNSFAGAPKVKREHTQEGEQMKGGHCKACGSRTDGGLAAGRKAPITTVWGNLHRVAEAKKGKGNTTSWDNVDHVTEARKRKANAGDKRTDPLFDYVI